jgi:hypothetical protein
MCSSLERVEREEGRHPPASVFLNYASTHKFNCVREHP